MNKEVLTKALIFAAGAAIGSAVTWKLVKTKYEKIAREEIESVKEAFSNRDITVEDIAEAAVKEGFHVDISVENAGEKEATIRKAEKIAAKMGYTETSDEMNEEEEEEMNEPYVISPEEFGEEDYAIITLIYYTDGIVANEQGKIVANTDELIGKDFAEHFGEYDYDPDTVYVRNDKQNVDYEIQKDYRAYSEID